MEMDFPFNLTTFFLFLSTMIFFLIKTKPKSLKSQPNLLPPSPPKLPVIGQLHHLLARDLPHKVMQRLAQKYGPVMHLQLGEVPVLVISSREATKEVLKAQDPACADRYGTTTPTSHSPPTTTTGARCAGSESRSFSAPRTSDLLAAGSFFWGCC